MASIHRTKNGTRFSSLKIVTQTRFPKIWHLTLWAGSVAIAPLTLTACAVAQPPFLERVSVVAEPTVVAPPEMPYEYGFGLQEFPPPGGAMAALRSDIPMTGEIILSRHGDFRLSSSQPVCAITGNVDRRVIRPTMVVDADLAARAFGGSSVMVVEGGASYDCRSRRNDILYISFNARLNAQGKPYVQQLFAWQHTDGVPTSWWVASVSREEMTNIEEKFRYRPAGLGEYDDVSDRERLYREFVNFLREHFPG